MALPEIAVPKFDLTLPISGKSIKFRPFLVKEQKLVLQAIEMQDKNQLENALDDVLKACTFGEVDIEDLPVADVEYMIIQIRVRSVGEKVDINYRCNNIVDKVINLKEIKEAPLEAPVEKKYAKGKCETKIPVAVQLGSLTPTVAEKRENRIMLTETIGLVMRDLKYGAYKKYTGEQGAAEVGMKMVAECIDTVFDDEQVYNRKDFTDEELEAFLENLIGDDFTKIEEWMDSMPKIEMNMELRCPSCGAKDKIHLSGLDDFLA